MSERRCMRSLLIDPALEYYSADDWYKFIKKTLRNKSKQLKALCFSLVWWNFIADRLPHNSEKWQKEMDRYNPHRSHKKQNLEKCLIEINIKPTLL